MIKKTTHIQDSLGLLGHIPTIHAPVPEYLFIASENARCPKAELFIKEGDYVKYGQVIGMRHAAFFDQPIHATCSGTFEGFEKHYHRSGKLVNFMKFHNDFLDTKDESIHERSEEEIKKLTKEEITEIVKNCASVGLGGSSFPTYIKFQTKEKINKMFERLHKNDYSEGLFKEIKLVSEPLLKTQLYQLYSLNKLPHQQYDELLERIKILENKLNG